MFIRMYGGKLQPKLLPKFYFDSILYEEVIWQVCQNLKSSVKLKEGKLIFMQYPYDLIHSIYWSFESLSTIYNMDTYFFIEVGWRGFDPYGHFATICRKLKSYMVSHEHDAFEDDALNNDRDLVIFWENHHLTRRIKSRASSIGYISQNWRN